MAATTTAAGRMSGIGRAMVALAAALVLGLALADHVAAEKWSYPANGESINSRVKAENRGCRLSGGTPTQVVKLPGGAKMTGCKGGTTDGRECVHGKGSTVCEEPKQAGGDQGGAGGVLDGVLDNPRPIHGVEPVDPPDGGEPVLLRRR